MSDSSILPWQPGLAMSNIYAHSEEEGLCIIMYYQNNGSELNVCTLVHSCKAQCDAMH